MDFQESVDYGMRHLNAKLQGKEFTQGAKPDSTSAEPVDRIEQHKMFVCVRCTLTHLKGECTALNKFC